MLELKGTARRFTPAVRQTSPPQPDPQLIYDVGLHDGNDTAYYLNLGFRVVAVEAHPVFVEAASVRFSQAIAAGRLQIVNVGISEGPGAARFWICDDHSDWSSFHREIASRNGSAHHAIQIPTVSFDTVLHRYGVPHYCKIDIEGNDELCLQALRPELCPPYISVELQRSGGEDPLSRLSILGYRRFKIIDQTRFCSAEPAIYRRLHARPPLGLATRTVNRLARSRRSDAGWDFRPGTSGPIGPRTPGRWLDLEQVTRVRDSIDGYMQRVGLSEWFDLHAAL